MTIVVDIGCHPQPPEESVHKLIDRFHPRALYGFDPHPDLVERTEIIDGTTVTLTRQAAWTSATLMPFAVDGIRSGIDADGSRMVAAFDLGEALRHIRATNREPVVLKLDCEGAEYPLLSALHERGVDELLELVLVEWHPPEDAHGFYLDERPQLRCPVEAW